MDTVTFEKVFPAFFSLLYLGVKPHNIIGANLILLQEFKELRRKFLEVGLFFEPVVFFLGQSSLVFAGGEPDKVVDVACQVGVFVTIVLEVVAAGVFLAIFIDDGEVYLVIPTAFWCGPRPIKENPVGGSPNVGVFLPVESNGLIDFTV